MQKAKEDLLVIAAQQGNERAFAFLFKYYQPPLLRFVYKLCNDQQLSHDAIQNAWIQLARNIRKLEDPRAFKSWVFKTTRWCVYELMRKSKREENVFDTEVCPEEVATPETGKALQIDNLIELINQLPEIDKEAIYLFYYEDMKINEISQILGIPSGTIKSRLNRARKTLHQQMINNGEL